MLLHIGDDRSIKKEEIIAILDSRVVKKSAITRDFVDRSRSVVNLASPEKQAVKSVIITEEKIYFSAISSTTLKKRFANPLMY